MSEHIFMRTERLLGEDVVKQLGALRVAVFGVGGVGSWCVEGLVRSGVGHLLLVDPDAVCLSNVNRQLPATLPTLGLQKVNVLRERMLTINPAVDIEARAERYTAATAESFALGDYDYVIDAIDSLADKALLIRETLRTRACLFSSMGAALKLNPERVEVTEFWKVKGCPLAAALRRRFKKEGNLPRRKFRCVYSDELLTNRGDTCEPLGGKAQINGSLVHITAIFGFTLAGLVVKDVVARSLDGV